MALFTLVDYFFIVYNMSTRKILKRKGAYMRKYIDDSRILKSVACDKCKRELRVENGIVIEGIFSVDYKWGYFSNKDGEMHSIDLCEKCYDDIIFENAINIKKIDETELI